MPTQPKRWFHRRWFYAILAVIFVSLGVFFLVVVLHNNSPSPSSNCNPPCPAPYAPSPIGFAAVLSAVAPIASAVSFVSGLISIIQLGREVVDVIRRKRTVAAAK